MPQVLTHDELLSLKFPYSDIIEQGILPGKSRLLLAGAHKLGKTILANQLACDLATGSRALDRFDVSKPTRVLIVEVEIGLRDFQKRWKKVTRNYKKALIRQNIRIIDDTTFTLEDRSHRALISALDFKPEVIIFDPLYLLHSHSEDKADQIKPILRIFNQLIEDTGAALIIIHHVRKPSIGLNGNSPTKSFELRGSSALPAWADTIVVADHISDSKDRALITFEGRSIEEPIDPLLIALDRKELRFHPITGANVNKTQDAIISCLLKLGGHVPIGQVAQQLKQERDIKYQTTRREIGELVQQGVLKREEEKAEHYVRFPWKLSLSQEAWQLAEDEDDEEL